MGQVTWEAAKLNDCQAARTIILIEGDNTVRTFFLLVFLVS